MNEKLIEEIANRILDIEHESIRKRREISNENYKGTKKADTDAVNKIIAVVNEEYKNEDHSN